MNQIAQAATKLDAAEDMYMRVSDLLLEIVKHGQQDMAPHVIQHLAQAAEAYRGAR